MLVVAILEGHISMIVDFRVSAYVLVCFVEAKVICGVGGAVGSHEGIYEYLHSNDINTLIHCYSSYININVKICSESRNPDRPRLIDNRHNKPTEDRLS